MTEMEQIQEQINELKAIIMEMRSVMNQHIRGYPDYSEE